MMTQVIVPVIMSGGSGTRLWPLSTEAKPKQFHALGAPHTLIQATAARLSGDHGDIAFAPPIVIGNISQTDLIATQLAELKLSPAEIILERAGRGTAAAGVIAALAAQRQRPDALVLLAPADHIIRDGVAFVADIARAARWARSHIVTFGIVPERPETGYGYIQAGGELGDGVHRIESFKEKPDVATASTYLRTGGYFWNSGLFLFSPELLLEEFAGALEIREKATQAYEAAERRGNLVMLGPEFAETPAQPIDIAVMERTLRGAVVPCNVGWADLGSWLELWRLEAQGDADNVVAGPAVARECAGSLIRAEGIRVAALGLTDFVVVATPEAVLIVPKDRAQDVKALREAALALPI